MNQLETNTLKRWLRKTERLMGQDCPDGLVDEIDKICDYWSNKEHLISLLPYEPRDREKQIRETNNAFLRIKKIQDRIFLIGCVRTRLLTIQHIYENKLKKVK